VLIHFTVMMSTKVKLQLQLQLMPGAREPAKFFRGLKDFLCEECTYVKKIS